MGAPGHRQARPRADPRDPLRPRPHGAGRVVRPLRTRRRRDRLRRGDREPRRHRGARRPRRPMGSGLCDRTARAARGAQVAPTAAAICRMALAKALVSTPGRRDHRRSPRATGVSSTSAPGSPTHARRRTCTRALDLIAGELHADKVSLSQWHAGPGHDRDPRRERRAGRGGILLRSTSTRRPPRVLERQEAVQVMVGDPRADRAEVELMLSLGYRSAADGARSSTAARASASSRRCATRSGPGPEPRSTGPGSSPTSSPP